MKIKENLWVILAVIIIAVITRIIPHYPNFTALGAAALFSGAYLRKPIAILIPVISLFISDLILNNLVYAKQIPGQYDGFVVFVPETIWSYAAFIIITLLSIRFIRTKLPAVIGGSVAASAIFFALSNVPVWLGSAIYPQTIAGLGLTYTVALPFFWNTVAGDLFFVAVFFGGYEIVREFLFKRQKRVA